jgi:hypothetical protein
MKVVGTEERRRSERVELKYKLTLRSEQKQHLFGTVTNISKQGMRILTLVDHEEGDNINLEIFLPEWLQAIYGKSIEIVASWRWCNPLNNQHDTPFYLAGYEFDLDSLAKESRLFIEHALEGIPDQIMEQACK